MVRRAMPRVRLLVLTLLLAACGSKSPDPVPPGDDPPPAGDCASLDEAGCAATADRCSPVQGVPEGDTPECSLPAEFTHCHSNDTACGDAITYARSPDGKAYWFSDTCIPEGWANEPYPDGVMEQPPPACE